MTLGTNVGTFHLTLLLTFVWPPEVSSQISSLNCYRRRCDQSIMGRNLRYERALEIIQSEEYLTATDLDFVRKRRRRFKRQGDQSPTGPDQDGDLVNSTTPIPPLNTTTSTTTNSPDVSLGAVAVTTGVLSLGGLAYLLLPSGPPILTPAPGVAPPGVPQPGQLGGGAPPLANSATAAEALNLAPLGTVPVAIFPPFLFPRTLPAIAVIFSETSSANDEVLARRTFQHKYSRQQGQLRSKHHPLRELKQRVGRFLDMVLRKRQMRERQFGFVVKVTLTDEMCQLGVSCDINGQSINATANRRQTGEEFSSTAPPDCRTTFVGCNP